MAEKKITPVNPETAAAESEEGHQDSDKNLERKTLRRLAQRRTYTRKF